MTRSRTGRVAAVAAVLAAVTGLSGGGSGPTQAALASHTPDPASVTIAGSLQSELGCPGDWQPDCATTHLVFDAADDVWQATFDVPAGSWEYKAALNDTWDENYGRGGVPNGPNVPLELGADTSVKFYYDHSSHWITDNKGSRIAVAPGSFQSELGCPGDWDPGCLRSWLQDVDGDGTFTFETTSLPAGTYEAKVALNESWDENYGRGGIPNGPNIPFTVPKDGDKVVFRYEDVTHVLTIVAGHGADDNVEWNGLRHDSRNLLYRTLGGAVQAGTDVKLRLRTFHDDVTAVRARLFDVNAQGQRMVTMTRAAAGVSCYQADLANETCDFWEATVASKDPNNVWYRFVVTDGADTDYYADDTPALDGGAGAPSEDAVDFSYALTLYDPELRVPAWSRSAVIYQIFPDRFRNGDQSNDPKTGDERYDDPVLALDWGIKPEGYCRNYQAPCPWRFDDTPPDWSPDREAPRGRDYYGGDLRGVRQKLDFLKRNGVTAIYFNPIFTAKSNHRYDTADFLEIDPALGDLREFQRLVADARDRGIRVILDGVFNHMSSDSPIFDRYEHYPEVGACESGSSQYRPWFTFRPPVGNEPSPCAPSQPGGNDTYYNGWFGFDSIPVLTKTLPEVQDYFVKAPGSVSRYWLQQGAGGWRLDVAGDPSFPDDYWPPFRQVVKATTPDALIIGELWQKDSTLLKFLRGERMDSTMNYRLRDAVLGYLSPGPFDPKGFADSGQPKPPSAFAARMLSQQEDYAPQVYRSLMNLLDSHDTERILWALTPGPENTQGREEDPENLAEGKRRMRLASLIQFTVPGAPTVYYGDEVGLNGDDDPDDRRTYPWNDQGADGEGLARSADQALLSHYRTLVRLQRENPALAGGDFDVLLADDEAGAIAYGRKKDNRAAVVAINRSDQVRTLSVPVAGFVPDGVEFFTAHAVGNPSTEPTAGAGRLRITLRPLSGILLATRSVDLTPPNEPRGLRVTGEGNGRVSLEWNGVDGARAYNVYRSPLSGGGYVKANAEPIKGTSFTDDGLANGRTLYYVVRALDQPGNESGDSAEVSALPHLEIAWSNLQWPPSLEHTISALERTDNVYGQVFIDGETSKQGPTPSLRAQLGFGPDGSNPRTKAWAWVEAAFNTDVGNNDEFVASLLPDKVGTFDYAYRYTTTDGRDWIYADLDGSPNGYSPDQAGSLTVNPSSDTTPPAVPVGLHVVSASPAGIELAWDPVTGDPTLYGYEVRRSLGSGGPYTTIATVTGPAYTDIAVDEGQTYYYVVRSVDTSFNRSKHSAEVSAKAELRTVNVVFTVTVPAGTPGDKAVYIAGSLNRLDPSLPEWDPAGVVLEKLDDTHWRVTLQGKESTNIEYKYTLGSWDFVEKGKECEEIANRLLTVSYGDDGTQAVNDTVANWRNVPPCGN